jgi:hypothetical protein
MRLQVSLAILCGLVVPIPLVVFNPDLARTPAEWVELFGGAFLCVSLVAALSAGPWRLFGGRPGRGACAGVCLWLIAALGLTGWIVSGPAGVLAGLLPFTFFAMRPAAARSRAGRFRSVASLAAVTVASASLISGLSLLSASPRADRQVIMIGLDGATWKIIDRLRDAGRLPTFDYLARNGARGELNTLSPIISPPIWTSIATGRSPEHHGVKDFWTSSDQVQAKTLWEIADERGMMSGVVGYLVTWPPRKQSGVLVPGWLARGPEAVPAELSFVKQLEIAAKTGSAISVPDALRLTLAAARNGITLSTVNAGFRSLTSRHLGIQSDLSRALDDKLLKLYLTTDVFCHLLRRLQPELGVYYYSSIDAVQHLFFKYYEPYGFSDVSPSQVAALGEAIPRMYQEVDLVIARILRSAHPAGDTIIVSDHGQRAARSQDEHWHVIKTSKLLAELGIATGLRATNLGTSVFLRSASAGDDITDALERIRSVVTVPGGESVFTLDHTNGSEALLKVHYGFDTKTYPTVRVGDREIATSDLIGDSERVSGEHTDTALLLMEGLNIIPGTTLPRRGVLDVAPTALSLLGLPIARDLEGRVIEEAFRPEFRARTALAYIDTYGFPHAGTDSLSDGAFDRATEEQLRSLGYVE